MRAYLPEGQLLESRENFSNLKTPFTLQDCMAKGRILEARARVCDSAHNLIVDLGVMQGIIPRDEGALGIAEGTTKDIAMISRVNKAVCFKITGFKRHADGRMFAMLSRRAAQQECMEQYIRRLIPGDVIPARVTHLESFGCFVDIGCGISSLIPIDTISVSRINHPRDRFYNGQDIRAVVQSVDADGRVCLTHKELLGTWLENAQMFQVGETVAGVVRSIENYGIFVELAPNLAGLAEPKENVQVGQSASVYIKSLIPNKMKVKLIIVDAFPSENARMETKYFVHASHIDHWRYSPEECEKLVESRFEAYCAMPCRDF